MFIDSIDNLIPTIALETGGQSVCIDDYIIEEGLLESYQRYKGKV